MQNANQMTRRKFITRLSTIAGGVVVAGSAADLLAGCGGGGLGGSAAAPGLPGLVVPAPVSPGAAGGAVGLGNVAVNTIGTLTAANVQGFINQIVAPGSVIAVSQGGNNVFGTLADLGITQADIDGFRANLAASGLLPAGGTVQDISFDLPASAIGGARRVTVTGVVDASGNVIFVPVFDAFFGNNDQVDEATNGTQKSCRTANFNSFTGRKKYVVTVNISATFNAAGVATAGNATVTKEFGPFVHEVALGGNGGNAQPVVTDEVDAVTHRNCKKATLDMAVVTQFFANKPNVVTRRDIHIVCRVCAPTGSGGQA